MSTVDLKYGRTSVSLDYAESRYELLEASEHGTPLSDAEVGERLERPIGSAKLEEIVRPGSRILLVVPDATRQSGSAQIVNLLIRRLIANGSSPGEINVIFATGIHRKVSDAEKRELLTPFIFQRIKTLDHNANDTVRNFKVGETISGIPVELDWVLTEFEHVVIIGNVTFHYFAGFTGGRKLICPGLASAKTIAATHKLAFDCEKKDRRQGVGTGLLDGNAVHEVFVEAAAKTKITFAINTIVDNAGNITDLFCGDWIASHREACQCFADGHTLEIVHKREVVIASCGGYPFDINLIQAHKALDAASAACRPGGTIILLANCEDGLGRDDFADWFAAKNSAALAERLCETYAVNGQTAWSLLKKAENFNIKIVTSLPNEICKTMRLSKLESLDAAMREIPEKKGYIIPAGSKLHIVTAGQATSFLR
jgi:nickel-dependent lactate racemase